MRLTTIPYFLLNLKIIINHNKITFFSLIQEVFELQNQLAKINAKLDNAEATKVIFLNTILHH